MADVVNMKKQDLVSYVKELQVKAAEIPNAVVPTFNGNLDYVGTRKEDIQNYAKELEFIVKDNTNLEQVATEDFGDLPFMATDIYKEGKQSVVVTIKYNPITKACAIVGFERKSHHMAARKVEDNLLESIKQEVIDGVPVVHKGYK